MPGNPRLDIFGRRLISFESACNSQSNIVNELKNAHLTEDFKQEIWNQREGIRSLVRHHLGLSKRDKCEISAMAHWVRGSYNICIPIQVAAGGISSQLMFRIPMPYKVAEAQYPGTVDEKISAEVGTYIWIQEHCHEIRVPHLYGFGFSSQQNFTHKSQRAHCSRLFWTIKRYIKQLLGFRGVSNYTLHPSTNGVSFGYLLIEYVDPANSQILSKVWNEYQNDIDRRQRLFRGLARVMISLASCSQSKIGALQFHSDCSVYLRGRPLTCPVIKLQTNGVLQNVLRSCTYSSTDSYVSDQLKLHDDNFLADPNAVYNEWDCRNQIAGKSILRALSHSFIKREYRNGPFCLQLTDFHSGNIFVDGQWNVTGIIDLEWVCALPREYMSAPYWISNRPLNDITNENYSEYDKRRQEFMAVFEEEERRITNCKMNLTAVMNEMWASKGVWFWYCLRYEHSMVYLVRDHICPNSAFWTPQARAMLGKLWHEESDLIVQKKVADYEEYRDELQSTFRQYAYEA